MNDNLIDQYIKALFRFRKSGLGFPKIPTINMTEFMIMEKISHTDFNHAEGSPIADIQDCLHITKPAISQVFTSLEKREFIIREIDKTNRRRIKISLTEEGKQNLKIAKKMVSQTLQKLFSSFGEEKTWQLISLLQELSDISDTVRDEMISDNSS
ncbi:MarR family winged helix-turn-helix transcriptional regulator [Scatolibacter rhodanostii]|uniref:MarR family winged helix-turn-helix transcriptional regulator n=1 Tax=Scatolibacter rhodanostii TaxID=2014781 RepID=UPI000C081511|nr:MarR family transcriptional regulator [Scatolibacter rhodanostii]